MQRAVLTTDGQMEHRSCIPTGMLVSLTLEMRLYSVVILTVIKTSGLTNHALHESAPTTRARLTQVY
jgi:hypothetical protein